MLKRFFDECSLFRFREIKEVLAIGKNLKFSFSVKYCTNMIPAAKSIVKGKNNKGKNKTYTLHCKVQESHELVISYGRSVFK